jgi:hypothetical protein
LCSSCEWRLVWVPFLTTRDLSLKLVEADCSIYSKQMKEFKLLPTLECNLIFWQSALNLMGFSENTTLLQGEAVIDSQEFLNRKSNPTLVAVLQAQQSHMHAIFGEHKKGADLSITINSSSAMVDYDPPLLHGSIILWKNIFV